MARALLIIAPLAAVPSLAFIQCFESGNKQSNPASLDGEVAWTALEELIRSRKVDWIELRRAVRDVHNECQTNIDTIEREMSIIQGMLDSVDGEDWQFEDISIQALRNIFVEENRSTAIAEPKGYN